MRDWTDGVKRCHSVCISTELTLFAPIPRWREWDVNWRLHMMWFGIVIAVGFTCVMLGVEENSSYVGGVPKEEVRNRGKQMLFCVCLACRLRLHVRNAHA